MREKRSERRFRFYALVDALNDREEIQPKGVILLQSVR
jgi:hypothetical protein